MSITIYGNTVGTPTSPKIIGEFLNPVKTVNGQAPDDNGNVDVKIGADKAEIEAFIATELAKRAQLKPEIANSVEECTDPTQLYVLPDGMIWAYMKTVLPGGEPLFTNAFDTVPVHLNKRWSHSSKALSDANGYFTTDLIPVRADQTIYMNIGNPDTTSGKLWYANYNRITYYGEDGLYVADERDSSIIRKVVMTHGEDLTTWVVGYYNDATGDPSTNERIASADNIRYMRLVFNLGRLIEGNDSLVLTEDHFKNAGLILSVGNPIAYSEPSEGYAWQSTGRAFVPADYEDRIIANEQKAASNTERIAELEERVENGRSEVLTDAEKLNLIKLWDKPVYDPSPVTLIADERAKPALSTTDRTIEAIYAKYRELLARFPQHITETNMGKSSSSDIFEAVDILRFDFREPDGRTNSGYVLYEQKPKLIFMSGVHTEWVGVWGLYYALEEIMTNPDFDDIRRNAHIIVVPCSNPFCLNGWTSSNGVDGWRMSHVNANGVAIHNNFHVDHRTKGNVGEYNYGGPAPCSEPETRYVDQIMAENPDAVAFISCHNNDYCTEFGTSVIWASSATAHMCNITFRLVDKLSKAWLAKYGQTLIDAINTYRTDALPVGDYRLGRAQLSTSAGTEAKNALKYGIQGVNVEISRMMKVFSGAVDGTSEVMTHGAEVYANLMRTLLATYDHKDKSLYGGTI